MNTKDKTASPNLQVFVAENRKEAGYSQKAFAAQVGITNKELQKIEHGLIEPSIEVLLRMCELLTCNISDLYVRTYSGPVIKMKRYDDITGKRFGKLVALGVLDREGKNRWWECACDCGRVVTVRGDVLRAGKKTSCGCVVAPTKRDEHYYEFPNAIGIVSVLPKGVDHGSSKALRYGCVCEKCSAKRISLKKHGVSLRGGE